MGVIKKLTDEYFEKTPREEDGKYIEIDGCRILVPPEFDEDRFLNVAQKIMNYLGCTFIKKGEKLEDGYVGIECAGEFIMSVCTYSEFSSQIDKFRIELNINETLYNSTIKLLKHYLKNIEVGEGEEVLIVDRKMFVDLLRKFPKHPMDDMVRYFTNDFKITSSDVVIDDENKTVSVLMRDFMFCVSLYTIRNIEKMKEWWKRKLKL